MLLWAWALCWQTVDKMLTKSTSCPHFINIFTLFRLCWCGHGQNVDTWLGWAKSWWGCGQIIEKSLMWSKCWCWHWQNVDVNKMLMRAKFCQSPVIEPRCPLPHPCLQTTASAWRASPPPRVRSCHLGVPEGQVRWRQCPNSGRGVTLLKIEPAIRGSRVLGGLQSFENSKTAIQGLQSLGGYFG